MSEEGGRRSQFPAIPCCRMYESALVLSYIEGYAARDIAPFVRSLRATGFEGDIVFFTHDVDDDCGRLFAEHGVRQIPVFRVNMKAPIRIPEGIARRLGIPNPLRPDQSINIRLARLFAALGMNESAVAQRVAQVLWHCNSGRFYYYQQFLSAHPEYDAVLIADVRDVVFQQSPFTERPDGLWLFEEYPGTTLGRQADNATWIRRLYGPAVLEELAHFPIVCAGVMMGGRADVAACVDAIAWRGVTAYVGWGTDQGTLNYLVRTGQLSGATVFPYGAGPAMHVGIAPRDTIRTDPQGRVLNREGEVCNIVHQYDRHPDLADVLLRESEPPVKMSSAR